MTTYRWPPRKSPGGSARNADGVHHDLTDPESRDHRPHGRAPRRQIHHRPDRFSDPRDLSHGPGTQYSASTANQAISIAAGNPAASDLEACCSADDEPLEGKRTFWPSFTALLHPLWVYFVLGLLAVAILQAIVPPRDIARYLHGGIGAYLLAAVAGIPLYVCEGAEVPLDLWLAQAGVGIGPAFTFMLGAVGTCIPTILMAPRIIGKYFHLRLCRRMVTAGNRGRVGNWPVITTDANISSFHLYESV